MRFFWTITSLVVALIAGGIYVIQPFPGGKARDAVGVRQTIERDGRTVVYFTQGAGPRIALAASAGREASDFNELSDALVAAGFRTVAVEAPGIGGTDLPKKPFSLYDLADDINAVLTADRKTVGGAKTVLVGHAFGNRVMRATAQRYPNGIKGIALIAAGGAAPVPEKAAQALRNCFDPLRTGSQRTEDVRYAFFALENGIPDYWLRGWHGKTAVLQGRATPNTDGEDWQSGGQAPMLVIQGVQDRIAPKKDAADHLADTFGDRVEVVLADPAGHALLPEQPELIADSIVKFATSVFGSE